jgi:hypothetical protein
LSKGGLNREILEETRIKMKKAKIGHVPHNKGKTNKEIYGEYKALKLKEHSSKIRLGQEPPNKGKTLEELYDIEKAKEIRKKLSKWKRNFKVWNKGLKGKDNPLYGKCPINQDQIKKLSEDRKGSGNPMYGKPAWNKGIPCNQQTKEKISKANKGRVGVMKGKKHSKETIKKLRYANQNKKALIRNDGVKYDFIEDAAKELGCSRHTIKRAIIGHPAYLRPYKGYTFVSSNL